MRAKKQHTLQGVFRGRIVMLLSRHWIPVLYVFLLIMVYMYLHYQVNDTSMTIIENNQALKELKTKFITRRSQYQKITTVKETTELLRRAGSTIQPPVTPPKPVTGESAAY